jgi:hypothetical protein
VQGGEGRRDHLPGSRRRASGNECGVCMGMGVGRWIYRGTEGERERGLPGQTVPVLPPLGCRWGCQ